MLNDLFTTKTSLNIVEYFCSNAFKGSNTLMHTSTTTSINLLISSSKRSRWDFIACVVVEYW